MHYGIDRLALDLLNFKKIATTDLIGKGKNADHDGPRGAERIALLRGGGRGHRAAAGRSVRRRSWMKSPALRKLNDELETPLIDVLVEMESNGIAIDPAILKEQSDVLGERDRGAARADLRPRPAANSTSIRPSSSAMCCSTSSGLKVVQENQDRRRAPTSEVLEKLAARAPGAAS